MLRPAFALAAPLLAAAGFGLVAPVAASAASSTTPYQDTSAVGSIGLCDKSGHEVTSGSTTAHPFVWRAVSTTAAAAPYNSAGRTATLYAFQPRKDVPAGDWSGDQLTASTRYSNAAHPMAAATRGDDSLQDFMGEFAPQWNGLYELRMFLGAPDQPADSFSYPAVSIQVTGTTWHVVNPATVSCTSGKATSIESILLPKSTTDGGHHAANAVGHQANKPGKSGNAAAGSHHPATTASGAPSTNGAMPASIHAAGSADSADSSNGSGSSYEITLLVVAGAILLAGAGAFRFRRSSVPARTTGPNEETK